MGVSRNRILRSSAGRTNPIPLLLIGAGVAWITIDLILKQRARDAFNLAGPYAVYEGYDENHGFGGYLRGRAAAVRARIARTLSQAGHGVATLGRPAAEAARDRAVDLAHAAQAKASVYGGRARQRLQETAETEPLVLGALGLALGAAIATALPAAARSAGKARRAGRRAEGAMAH